MKMKTTVTRGSVLLNGNEMEYFTFGSGETPMVILPGLSVRSVMQSAEGVASAYRLFSDRFKVYCFDRTKTITENITIEELSEDTACAMRTLGIQNACVFGASQGGMIAQYIAICHPDLVGKLLLGSTCARLNAVSEAVMQRWITLAEAGNIEAFMDGFIDVLYGKAFAESFGEFIRVAHRDTTAADFRRFIRLGRSCDTLNTYDLLDRIQCPTLVVGAIHDRVLTAQSSFEIAEKLGCPCYFYGSEYGHCAFDEAPDYKQRMFDFFTEAK